MAWVIPIMAALAGCSAHDVFVPEVGRPLSPPKLSAARVLQGAQDDFAFRLKDALLKQSPKGNLCFSPLSLNLSLSVLLAGSNGDSVEALRDALAYGLVAPEEIDAGNQALLTAMSGDSFHVANAVVLADDVAPRPEFAKEIAKNYAAEILGGQAFDDRTVRTVNDWASKKTDGKIKNLVTGFGPTTKLAIVDAFAFEGEWMRKFPVETTAPHSFTLASGEVVSVPMMNLVAPADAGWTYGDRDGVPTLILPYLGGHFEFLAMLPPPGQVASAFLEQMTPEWLREHLKDMMEGHGVVALPKFSLAYRADLNQALRSMGLSANGPVLDLSKIDPKLKDQVISGATQECRFQVDEAGSQAYVATQVHAATKAAYRPFEFVADRPFVFAILHAETGAILLMGVVNDPRSTT